MALRRHSSTYDLTIPAGAGRVLPQHIAGRFWTYVEGPGALVVRFDETPSCIMVPGQGIRADDFVGRDEFERFELSNPTGLEITVRLWVGYTEFTGYSRNQVEAPTEFVPFAPSGDYAPGILAANGVIDLPGTSSLARIRRKAVQIANLDPSATLYLCDAANVVGMVVRAGETITQPLSGFVRLRNTNAAPMAIYGSELWWLP
jgi:hypothetical protein